MYQVIYVAFGYDLNFCAHKATGSFTLQVPLPSTAFNNGPGDYVIKAAVTNADGVSFLHVDIHGLVKFQALNYCFYRRSGM